MSNSLGLLGEGLVWLIGGLLAAPWSNCSLAQTHNALWYH